MPGSWPAHNFPHLNPTNHSKASDATRVYNCLAWAAGEAHRRWEPDSQGQYYWPRGALRNYTLPAFMQAYQTRGYEVCPDGAMEADVEKIAIFCKERSGLIIPTHAALQLETGVWTSKLGDFEDIEHATVDAVKGPVYGEPKVYMKRPRQSA